MSICDGVPDEDNLNNGGECPQPSMLTTEECLPWPRRDGCMVCYWCEKEL